MRWSEVNETFLSKIKVTWTQAPWYRNSQIWWVRQLLGDWQARNVCSMGTLDKGMIHLPGRTEQDSVRFHHTTPKRMHFKTYELFVSGILHFIFLDCNWLWVIENAESETADKGWLLYNNIKKENNSVKHSPARLVNFVPFHISLMPEKYYSTNMYLVMYMFKAQSQLMRGSSVRHVSAFREPTGASGASQSTIS